ncbi:MAG: BRO-N domain-containing protein [Acidiferrobacter sp.]|jgi:prophage antirepressor-like protein
MILGEDGEPWFVAVDVCKVLGLADVSVAMRKLDNDEKTTRCLTPGLIEQGFSDNNAGTSLNFVNESGLYSLILTSRKPEANAFALAISPPADTFRSRPHGGPWRYRYVPTYEALAVRLDRLRRHRCGLAFRRH